MSNYHILSTDLKLKTINVVFHIPIPSANNAVGVNWQNALVFSLGGVDKINSILPNISLDDEMELDAGSLFEILDTVRFSSLNLTNAQRLAEVEVAYTVKKLCVLAEIQISLNYYGKNGDVA